MRHIGRITVWLLLCEAVYLLAWQAMSLPLPWNIAVVLTMGFVCWPLHDVIFRKDKR